MPVITTPVNPPQPADPFYPGSVLNILPTYTRASYATAQGMDAPTGDITRKPKYWADSTVGTSPNVTVNYQYFDTSTSPATVKTMSMTAAEASEFNIPGLQTYPKYIVASTQATSLGAPVNPNSLSTLAQADAIAVQWGLDPAVAVSQNLGTYSWPDNEPRRVYEITLNGTQYNIGELLVDQNTFGVGALGMWMMNAPGGPQWVLMPPKSQNFTAAPWPNPIRKLLANEGIAAGGGVAGGQTVIVYNTTMNSPYNPNTNASAGSGGSGVGVVVGGLTVDQDARLTRIDNNLVAIAKAFGVVLPS